MNNYIEFYWSDNADSYAEAKRNGALRTVRHDYLQHQTSLMSGMAADIRDIVFIGADMISGDPKIHFFLFRENGTLLDAT